ncbi:hypothetical protein F444_20858 [Phytophthora nicotianae P1976]|uniref:Uncharacterized protein n=1 Tax=Phytophthora nicotianae P1976 TaxID=1317066 RepID=A0A080Z351_PHYNI|nr:hypothetical protein F444_20858 [Phytophthora nicotianae P1976]
MVLTLRVFGKTINQFELLEFINRDDENRAEFTPPASENKKLKVLLETLGRIQSESRQLQSDDVMLWEIQGELSWLAPITSLLVSGFNLRKQHLLNRQGKKAVQPFLRQPESEVIPEG